MAALQAAPGSMPYAAAYASAVTRLSRAVREAPWWPVAYYDLGLVQETMGRPGAAADNLLIYLQLYPATPDAAKVRQRIGDLERSALSSGFVNGLGMRFAPVPGTKVLFSKWDTRVADYAVFAQKAGLKWPKPRFPQTAAD